MGTVHNLILLHGLDRVRSMAETKAERQAVQAAAAVMAEERSGLGITHAGFAMTSLPHKHTDEALWETVWTDLISISPQAKLMMAE